MVVCKARKMLHFFHRKKSLQIPGKYLDSVIGENIFGLCAVNGWQFFWTLRSQRLSIFLDSVRSMQTFLALKCQLLEVLRM